MSNKIESVYIYTIIFKDGRKTRLECEVYYKTGRTFRHDEEQIPLTVINFIKNSKSHKKIKNRRKAKSYNHNREIQGRLIAFLLLML